MAVGNYPQGPFILACGSDGTNPIVLYTDASGHLQVDVLSLSGLDALATEATLQAVRDRIGALTSPAAGSVNKQLADILAELLAKLETADLNIEAGSKDLQVDVKSSALPTGAATQTTLANILTKLDVALSTRAAESGGNLAAAVTALQLIDDFALGTNKLFGYNDVYQEIETATGDGTAKYLVFSTVPSGEVWVIQTVLVGNTLDSPNAVVIDLWEGANQHKIGMVPSLAALTPLGNLHPVILKYGQFLTSYWAVSPSGATLFAHATGYKMKIS